jgi:hypothetical protein
VAAGHLREFVEALKDFVAECTLKAKRNGLGDGHDYKTAYILARMSHKTKPH